MFSGKFVERAAQDVAAKLAHIGPEAFRGPVYGPVIAEVRLLVAAGSPSCTRWLSSLGCVLSVYVSFLCGLDRENGQRYRCVYSRVGTAAVRQVRLRCH